ncbi:hypothetical protein LO763_25770 [Glycomyces sp. A-F 0318]|uniref:hypothetical protein n=1 Tax=Glycomyces amatae TaxID=2881355 RepID=UPI001E636E23|nr:hypothetical protein [Glycomyces amatae]MCD0447030.1 hypothetical protein [Glycomyces amatae]
MTDTERANPSRRRLLTTAVLLPAAAAVGALGFAGAAHADYNGPIKRSQVMNRAHEWFERNVQYDMGATVADAVHGCHRYRTDCSGFVSMCWHSPAPGHSTRTLPNISRQILWRELKAGDIVNAYDNHVMLFDSWSIDSGYMWYYDLATPALDMRHKRIDANILQNQGYVPRRYKHIENG